MIILAWIGFGLCALIGAAIIIGAVRDFRRISAEYHAKRAEMERRHKAENEALDKWAEEVRQIIGSGH